MRLEVASQVHLQPGRAAAGACRGQAYCLFVWGPLGQRVARSGPTLPTVSLTSSAVWHLLLGGKEKEVMSGVCLALCRGLNPGCSSFRGPVDDPDPEGAENPWSDPLHRNSPRSLNWRDTKELTGWFVQSGSSHNLFKTAQRKGGACVQPCTPTHTSHGHIGTPSGPGAALPSAKRPCPCCFLHWQPPGLLAQG